MLLFRSCNESYVCHPSLSLTSTSFSSSVSFNTDPRLDIIVRLAYGLLKPQQIYHYLLRNVDPSFSFRFVILSDFIWLSSFYHYKLYSSTLVRAQLTTETITLKLPASLTFPLLFTRDWTGTHWYGIILPYLGAAGTQKRIVSNILKKTLQ